MTSIVVSVMMALQIGTLLDFLAFFEVWIYAMGIFFSFLCEVRKSLKAIWILGLIATLGVESLDPIAGLVVLPFILTALYLASRFSKS